MNKFKSISVIGAGAWGTAIAKVIAESSPGVTVKLWCYEKYLSLEINSKSVNSTYLPGISLPGNIQALSNPEIALENSKIVIFALPSIAFESFLARVNKKFDDDVFLISGIDGLLKIKNRFYTPCEYLENFTENRKNILTISGLPHIDEFLNSCFSTITFGGDSEVSSIVKGVFNSKNLVFELLSDRKTIEWGNLLIQPILIISGIISEMDKCGEDMTGLFFSRVLNEARTLFDKLNCDSSILFKNVFSGRIVSSIFSEKSVYRSFGAKHFIKIKNRNENRSIVKMIYILIARLLFPRYYLKRELKQHNYYNDEIKSLENLVEYAGRIDIKIPIIKSINDILVHNKNFKSLIKSILD